MQAILKSLDRHFGLIDGAMDELNPPATAAMLDAAEQELGVRFPADFRQLYLWHDAQRGCLFLFDSLRLSPCRS